MPSDKQLSGPHLALTPEAGVLLDLLQELGHLDEVSISAITAALSGEGPEASRDPSGIVELVDLRRAIAAVLFERSSSGDKDKMNPEQAQLLEKEWRLLFG